MTNKFRYIASILLLVVYAAFFASTNMFYHVHYQNGNKVVHSHFMFGGENHSHNSFELQLIAQVNTLTYDSPETLQVELPQPTFIDKTEAILGVEYLFSASSCNIALRAPPAG